MALIDRMIMIKSCGQHRSKIVDSNREKHFGGVHCWAFLALATVCSDTPSLLAGRVVRNERTNTGGKPVPLWGVFEAGPQDVCSCPSNHQSVASSIRTDLGKRVPSPRHSGRQPAGRCAASGVDP